MHNNSDTVYSQSEIRSETLQLITVYIH